MEGKLSITDGAASSSSATITLITPLMTEIKQAGTVLESAKKVITKNLGELKLLHAKIETSKSKDKAEYKDKCKQAIDSLTDHEEDCNLYLAKIVAVEDEDEKEKNIFSRS